MKKTNILIVDDNISLAETMSFILEKKEYRAITAKNGNEAIEKVKNKFFDIIFMDIKMPVMNGVEACKKIKKISSQSKVFMMTAYAVEELIQEALKEGASGILYKPLDIEKMLTLIEEVLKEKTGIFILITDDDPSFAITLSNIFKERDFEVCIAGTGEEAISKVKRKDFDIVFLDIKLPTINGLETYLELKKIKPDIIVVMITGYSREFKNLIDMALENSALTCLSKPLNIEKVLNITEEILERKN